MPWVNSPKVSDQATLSLPDSRNAATAARISCIRASPIRPPPTLTTSARTRSSWRARRKPSMTSGSLSLRRDMIADSGSVTGPSPIPSVRSSSRISGAVWRCRSLETCSVICRASCTSAMRSAYGAEEIRIGGHLVTIVVDVANVMGSRPDGWWRDRAGARPGCTPRSSGWPPVAARSRQMTMRGRMTMRSRLPFVLVLEGAAKAAPIPVAPFRSPQFRRPHSGGPRSGG